MITPTNTTKNTISPVKVAKTYAIQGVYGIGVYGLAIYGVGSPNFGTVTNQSKNSITPTNTLKN